MIPRSARCRFAMVQRLLRVQSLWAFMKAYPQLSDKAIMVIIDMLWLKRTRFQFQFQDLVTLLAVYLL